MFLNQNFPILFLQEKQRIFAHVMFSYGKLVDQSQNSEVHVCGIRVIVKKPTIKLRLLSFKMAKRLFFNITINNFNSVIHNESFSAILNICQAQFQRWRQYFTTKADSTDEGARIRLLGY